jgi:starch synthase (maltosyl-transferring)
MAADTEPTQAAGAPTDPAPTDRPQGPRIYNLFPTLLGPVPRWHERLPAIAGMGFDWIFLNPVHLPGASGSLYAIKDARRLHPLLLPNGSGEGADADALLRDFCAAAGEAGIRVMLDLVINHSARDGVLVDTHPEWFAKDADGAIRSPSVADLDDPDQVTVWEDLAELDYSERPARDAMLAYWEDLIRRYLGLGFAGFRCDAAYKVPGAVWRRLIDSARAEVPDARFFAESLGAPAEDIEQLGGAGFDYLFNSAKWWDFRQDWLLEQYERFRDLAPSIAFPESHDTPRLAAETRGSARESRFRYLFAAVFSTGVMMPIGYEFGFKQRLHVVKTTPDDWDTGRADSPFDISDDIRRINAMKAATPVLNEEGPQERVTAEDQPLMGLLRRARNGSQRSLALINPDRKKSQSQHGASIAELLGAAPEDIREITPASKPSEKAAEKPAGDKSQPGAAARRKTDEVRVPPRGIRIFVTG